MIEIAHGYGVRGGGAAYIAVRLKSSIAISQQDGNAVGGVGLGVGHNQVYLAVFVQVHRSQADRRRAGSKFQMCAERAVALLIKMETVFDELLTVARSGMWSPFKSVWISCVLPEPAG